MTPKELKHWINENAASRNQTIEFVFSLGLDRIQTYHLMVQIFKTFDY